jgi:hypothetical protein
MAVSSFPRVPALSTICRTPLFSLPLRALARRIAWKSKLERWASPWIVARAAEARQPPAFSNQGQPNQVEFAGLLYGLLTACSFAANLPTRTRFNQEFQRLVRVFVIVRN